MIFDIDESDTPNKWSAVQYPHCAVNTQITQAILCSTSIAFRIRVSGRSTSCRNCLTNICIDSLHSKVVKPLFPCQAWYNSFPPTATPGEHPDRAVFVTITSHIYAYCHHTVMTSGSRAKIRPISSGVHQLQLIKTAPCQTRNIKIDLVFSRELSKQVAFYAKSSMNPNA